MALNVGSASLALASLQRSGTDQVDIVQIGIARCTSPQGCGGDAAYPHAGNVPADGVVHFVYTKFDDSGGRFYLADGWYGGAPILGHRYRMKVGTNGTDWGYYIRDITDNESYVIKYRDRTWNSADLAWYGGETLNRADAMGNPYPALSDLNIASQYRKTDGSWWQTDGPTQACTKQFPTEAGYPGWPTYWSCFYTTVNQQNDRQQVRTNDH